MIPGTRNGNVIGGRERSRAAMEGGDIDGEQDEQEDG
jgi:hypothetical protein